MPIVNQLQLFSDCWLQNEKSKFYCVCFISEWQNRGPDLNNNNNNEKQTNKK